MADEAVPVWGDVESVYADGEYARFAKLVPRALGPGDAVCAPERPAVEGDCAALARHPRRGAARVTARRRKGAMPLNQMVASLTLAAQAVAGGAEPRGADAAADAPPLRRMPRIRSDSPSPAAEGARARYATISDAFIKAYGQPPTVFARAPGACGLLRTPPLLPRLMLPSLCAVQLAGPTRRLCVPFRRQRPVPRVRGPPLSV
jgi:hypothetical protein